MSKHKDHVKSAHVNVYASPSSRKGDKEKSRSSRQETISNEDNRERRILGELYQDTWNIPRQVIFDGAVYAYEKPVPITEKRTQTIPARYSWERSQEVTQITTLGYKGSYVKERELSFFEQQQMRKEAEAQARKEARKNKTLIGKIRDGMELR